MTHEIHGETLELLPEKAFFWPRKKILGLSDVHLGKLESYQKMGIPVPSGEHQEDLLKISKLVETWRPEQVYILGDWIHDQDSWTEEIILDLERFFFQHAKIQWFLILGNHERGSLPFLEKLPLKLLKESVDVPPFRFAHGHLKNQDLLFQIEGHIHPVITLATGPLKMKLPCFVQKKNSMVIPSFGGLTGGYEMAFSPSDRVFAVTPKEVFEVRI